MIKIYVGSDHRGQDLARELIEDLHVKGLILNENVFTQGPIRGSIDYPDRVPFVIQGVRAGGKGLLICGSGIGMSIAANRFKGIQAALCYSPDHVVSARKHNNANILVLSGDMDRHEAKACLALFLSVPFEGERHERRLEKIDHISTL